MFFLTKKKSVWKTKGEGIIMHFFERVFPGFLTFIFPEELDGLSDLIRDVVNNKVTTITPRVTLLKDEYLEVEMES